jgi:hypothetical protein
MRKLWISKAPALLLMADWPRKAWNQPAMDMITKVDRLPLACEKGLNRDTTTESILAYPSHRGEPAFRRLPVPTDPDLTRFPLDGRDTMRRCHPSHLGQRHGVGRACGYTQCSDGLHSLHAGTTIIVRHVTRAEHYAHIGKDNSDTGVSER